MEVRPGYKQTELGVIPEQWEVRPLGDLTTTVASGTSKAEATYGRYPVHGSTGVIGYSDNAPYEGDAILVARVGANAGRLNIVSGRYGVTDNTIIVRLRSGFCLPFFWRQMETKRLNRLVFGSGQPLITGTQVKALAVAVPRPAEQHAIASALSDVDALLAKLDALIAKKRDLKQAAMQQLLTGQQRLPGFSGAWEVKRLGEIAQIGRGRVISHREISASRSSQYPVYSSQTWNNGVMGYIDTSDFDGEYVTWTTDGVNAGKVFYRKGRFNCTNVCGTIKVLSRDAKLVALALDRVARKYVSTNLANPKLMNGVMKQIELLLPPTVEEQTAIAAVLSDMDAEIAALEASRDKNRALKQGIMQELLTGRIRLV